jgi:hypothetical protein
VVITSSRFSASTLPNRTMPYRTLTKVFTAKGNQTSSPQGFYPWVFARSSGGALEDDLPERSSGFAEIQRPLVFLCGVFLTARYARYKDMSR